MAETLRDVIKGIVKQHLLEKGGKAFGQCLTAVGWVGGTLPELYEEDGMVELSMADVAGGGIVVGAGLAGIRPIYIIRYQGFNWFNSPIIANYACKSKEIWNIPCPIFIRSISMEGGIGPVASSSHHSLYFRMPGIVIASPMTPAEYRDVYENFMRSDDVVYVSEHRGAYGNTEELEDIHYSEPDVVLFPISITRFAAQEASRRLSGNGIKVAVYHQLYLKPLAFTEDSIASLRSSKYGGLVTDDDYVDGVARAIAHRLQFSSNKLVDVMGLDDRTAGFHPDVDNLPPNADDICNWIMERVSA